jgi:hypothetical protein
MHEEVALRSDPLTDLRTRIERGEYKVDPGVVAGSLLGKLEVIRRVRLHLLTQAGRTRQQPGRLH